MNIAAIMLVLMMQQPSSQFRVGITILPSVGEEMEICMKDIGNAPICSCSAPIVVDFVNRYGSSQLSAVRTNSREYCKQKLTGVENPVIVF